VRGRIAPLLSLGAGFQPDMTGRECVEINATALGLTDQEIREQLAHILEWADLKDFLDTPMRFYSSGMVARLGFSVAIHTKPDLLLVDEVLSVGDHTFQKKCVERIHKLQKEGVTLLIVSHAAGSLEKLCQRVLWLREGSIVADGPPGPVIAEYMKA
jgi:ABC-type polysaccharide/polyol phosphate transport system ATPase subunit